AASSGSQCFSHQLFGLIHCVNQDFCLGERPLDLTRCFKAVQIRQFQIDDRDIGLQLCRQLDSCSPVASLCAAAPTRTALDHRLQTLSNCNMVIDEQNPSH